MIGFWSGRYATQPALALFYNRRIFKLLKVSLKRVGNHRAISVATRFSFLLGHFDRVENEPFYFWMRGVEGMSADIENGTSYLDAAPKSTGRGSFFEHDGLLTQCDGGGNSSGAGA